MKKKFIALALAFGMIATCGLAACNGKDSGDNDDPNKDNPGIDVPDIAVPATGTFSYETYENVSNTEYNKNLYFLNDLLFEIADPTVIYVDECVEDPNEVGYFYAYGTSDLVGCRGIQCWRSKDLTNWEYKSVAYQPDFDNTWAYNNHWAPEVIYDRELKKFFIFYNADNIFENKAKYISIAYSDTPYGPFVPEEANKLAPAYDFSPNNNLIPKEYQRSNTIDVHPFIDPVYGNRYLYYSGYGKDGNNENHGQTIFGVEMEDWYTPKYETLKELTHLFRISTSSDEVIDEGVGTVNEGPFMWYEDGMYYLTFSVYPYDNEGYQVRQALADSPLGDFVKVRVEEGAQILATDATWGNIVSAGHHCFITCGDKLMIAYHTFKNRSDISGGRALAVDTINFVKNRQGVKLMHANGPTYSYQPLPEEISGYKNLAPQATVTVNNAADGSDVKLLTDDTLKIHASDYAQEFNTKGGNTTITLTFDKFINARSILIYNSIYRANAFWGINSIKLSYKTGKTATSDVEVKNIPFDSAWHTRGRTMFPGATSILEFDELPINKITITIAAAADTVLGINEIMVLGKEVNDPAAVKQFTEYSYTNPAPVQPLPVYESLTFGSADNGRFKSNYGYDLSHDDGTSDGYVDKVWSGNTEILYFKDFCSVDFYVEAELSVLNHTMAYEGDEYPKIGIMFKSKTNYFAYFNIDCLANYSNNRVGYVESNAAGSDYVWSRYADQSADAPFGFGYTGTTFAKLAIARIGDTVYFFANDQLMAFGGKTAIQLSGLTDDESTASAVGFLSYNTFTRFKNYSITGDRAEVLQKLSDLGVTV